jgi:hypothetical protein
MATPPDGTRAGTEAGAPTRTPAASAWWNNLPNYRPDKTLLQEGGGAVELSVRLVQATDKAGGMNITVLMHATGPVEREPAATTPPPPPPARECESPKPSLTGVSAARLRGAAAAATGPITGQSPKASPPPPPHGSPVRPQKLPKADTLHQLIASLSPKLRRGDPSQQEWRGGRNSSADSAAPLWETPVRPTSPSRAKKQERETTESPTTRSSSRARGERKAASISPKANLLPEEQADRQRHWQHLCDQREVLGLGFRV